MADADQMAAAGALQVLYSPLTFKVKRGSTLNRLLAPPVPRGRLFWGGVGRGKSFLMDCFFDAVPYRRKRRIHFHDFMHRVHRDVQRSAARPIRCCGSPATSRSRSGCFASTSSTSPTSPMR